MHAAAGVAGDEAVAVDREGAARQGVIRVEATDALSRFDVPQKQRVVVAGRGDVTSVAGTRRSAGCLSDAPRVRTSPVPARGSQIRIFLSSPADTR